MNNNNLSIDGICFNLEKSESGTLITLEYNDSYYKCLIPEPISSYLENNWNQVKINLDSGFSLELDNIKLKFEETWNPEDKYIILDKKWEIKFSELKKQYDSGISELKNKFESELEKQQYQIDFQEFNYLNILVYHLSSVDSKKIIQFHDYNPINYFQVNLNYKKLELLKKSQLELIISYYNTNEKPICQKFRLSENLDYRFETKRISGIRLDLVNKFGDKINIIPDDYIIKVESSEILNIIKLSRDFRFSYLE